MKVGDLVRLSGISWSTSIGVVMKLRSISDDQQVVHFATVMWDTDTIYEENIVNLEVINEA